MHLEVVVQKPEKNFRGHRSAVSNSSLCSAMTKNRVIARRKDVILWV